MTASFIDLASDRAALAAVLVELGLCGSDAAAEVVVTPLTGGVSSSIFRIDLPSGRFCVKQALPKLKVASDWRAPTTRVFAEIDWLEQVGHWHPAHVPKVIAVHRPSGAFVMPYLEAAQWSGWKARLLAADVDQTVAQRLGGVLADIHARSSQLPALPARFANSANFLALRLDPYLLETARRTPALAGRLQAIVEATQHHARALVHGDVSPKNILVGTSAPGQFMLLDAECATWGDPAFDLAFLLNHFLLKAVHLPAQRDEFLGAFGAIANAYRASQSWEPARDFESRAAALLAGLFLARVDGKSPVEYLSTESQARVRQIATRCLIDGIESLDGIAARLG